MRTYGTDSSFVGYSGPDQGEGVCQPVTFIDIDRLPPDPLEPFTFVSAANEHEMGHAYGLGHVCGVHTDAFDDSNIMQTSSGNCCIQCSQDLEDTGIEDTGTFFWQEVGVDCSATHTGYTPPPSCDSSWNDCVDCTTADTSSPPTWDVLAIGNRTEPFSDTEIGAEADGGGINGQLEEILETAIARCQCECDLVIEKTTTRLAVKGEPSCSVGSGRFALLMNRRQDKNDDDDGFAELTPILISGNHMGRLAWITDVDFVSFGDFSQVAAPTAGNGFTFDAGDPDDLITTQLEVFDAVDDSGSYSMGTIATSYPWGVEGLDMTETEYDWPVVDLEWDCNSDYGAGDVYRQHRPVHAYRLPIDDVYGSWDQELLLRPKLSDLELWFEVHGHARTVTIATLTAGTNGRYHFSLDHHGLTMDGWIKRVGQPVGSKLRLHIEDGQYKSYTWEDETLPDLLKMP